MWIAIPVALIGYSLIYAGLKGVHPWCPFLEAFGAPCPPAPGSASSLAGGLAPGGSAPSGGPAPPPSGSVFVPPGWPGKSYCGTPPLVHAGIVSLQKPAMDALTRANERMRAAIGAEAHVVSSFRTCAQQCATCLRHGCPCPGGCPGTCAPVGKSCHQLGLAVDLSNYAQAKPYMVAAGFSEPLPGSDPGHFQYQCPG